MPERPPASLVALLERLDLAAPEQVARMGRRVKRLARDLPRFESVWVDALMQARVLTPFQAAEINAGRGAALRLGPYVIQQRLAHPYYVQSFRVWNLEERQPARLAVVERAGPRTEQIFQQLKALAEIAKPIDQPSPLSPLPSPLFPITHVGVEADRVYAAAAWEGGRAAADWMIHRGRFPAEVVLEIARAMLAQLVELERLGICHGDVGLASLALTDAGEVSLALPGLRGVLRPEEGYAHGDLPPEGYDGLAPERVAAGAPPTAAGDLYACGCLWWHLVCGRPPLTGGDSLAKLRAAQSGAIDDPRRYASDLPAPLASAIAHCLKRDPADRPESFKRLAAMLGPPTRSGKETVADCLARAGRPTVRWTTTARKVRKSSRTPFWIAGAVCCLAAAVALCWPAAKGEKPVASGQWPVASKPEIPKSRNPQIPKSTFLPDSDVVPTVYQQPVKTKPADLTLDEDNVLESTSLDLREGQCVRGPAGRRATVRVSGAGLIVDKADVRFEHIDFVWRPTAADAQNDDTAPALVRLLAGRAEFRGCSFRCEGGLPNAAAAVRWVHPSQADATGTSLSNGWVRFSDCLLYRVAAGLDCQTIAALVVELDNVLHLESGPLVRLDHVPRADEPVSMALRQVTLRGGGPMLECLAPWAESQPGEITVLATACALIPGHGEPLVRLSGREMSERLPASLRWSGQGSIAAPAAAVIAWRGPDGGEQIVDESSLSIAGLVRSEVQFAARASGDPADSLLIRWQAPLQSADPPGADPAALPRIAGP